MEKLPSHAVKAFILNSEGQFLLLQRNPLTRNGEDNWDLPGGLVELNEEPELALLREIKEELQIDVVIEKVSTCWNFVRSRDGEVVDVQNYTARIKNFEQKIILSNEHIACKWVNPEDIEDFKIKDPSFIESVKAEFK